MSNQNCPYCGATPYNPQKHEGIQARCDECNGLISLPEDEQSKYKEAEAESPAPEKEAQPS